MGSQCQPCVTLPCQKIVGICFRSKSLTGGNFLNHWSCSLFLRNLAHCNTLAFNPKSKRPRRSSSSLSTLAPAASVQESEQLRSLRTAHKHLLRMPIAHCGWKNRPIPRASLGCRYMRTSLEVITNTEYVIVDPEK